MKTISTDTGEQISGIFSLNTRRFLINRIEDPFMAFERKPETPTNVRLFPEEADRVHGVGHNVFTLTQSSEDPNEFVLRVHPSEHHLSVDSGLWIVKLGDKKIPLGSIKEPLYLPEVGGGNVGFYVGTFSGTFEEAVKQSTRYLRKIGQLDLVFDFSDRFLNVTYKGLLQ